MEEPCRPDPIGAIQATVEKVPPLIASNNKCAKRNLDRYIELQRWVRGRAE